MFNQKMKLLPYGISDFRRIREENLYYVDKSEYIAKMEEACSFLNFVRPRRFGKSLFLSMLSEYYDVRKAGRFDELFRGLWIHDNPTKYRGKYLIMHLDLSQISSDLDSVVDSLEHYISLQINMFLWKYKEYFSESDIEHIKSFNDMYGIFNAFNSVCKRLKLQRYLIVDEYDSLSNEILNLRDSEVDKAKIERIVFNFQEAFAMVKGQFERVLMMGVSPISMSSLTYGYDIATDITFDPRFNSALGFTENDVCEMIEYYRSCGAITREADDIIKQIKPWYGTNCFSGRALNDERVFNSSMIFYYMGSQIREQYSLREMIDQNAVISYGKLKRLINIADTTPFRKNILRKIAEDDEYITNIERSVPIECVRDLNVFEGLLYYYGMLTISGKQGEHLILTIPNRCMRDRYMEFMREYYADNGATIETNDLHDYFRPMAKDGDFEPFVNYLAKSYCESATLRSVIQSECGVRAYLLAHLDLTSYFFVKTETEKEGGFASFVLYPNVYRFDYLRHAYIVELKYISETDDTPELRLAKLAEASEKLAGYVIDTEYSAFPQDAEIHKVVVMCAGNEMIVKKLD